MKTHLISILYLISIIPIAISASTLEEPILRSTANGPLVGTISGKVEVTPTGAATYTIPLDLPKGCGGLTPEICITYNSMSNLGNMGWGCSLTGISQITRVPRDIYHDNEITAVDFSDKDCFALDGIRLIRNSITDTVFYPEINNLARVVADSPRNPQRFTVYSPDGIVTTYGTTSNSQVQGTGEDAGKILIWKADRVTDGHSNYYTINYVANNERTLKSIDYSANLKAGIQPTLSIEFEYTSNGGIYYEAYINSTSICKSNAISKIQIKKGSKLLRKYDINYNTTAFPTINSITLTGSDGISKYKPTVFDWNDENKSIQFNTESNSVFDKNVIKDTKQYTGDFNGDGTSEIILLSTNNSNWEGIRIYSFSSYASYSSASKLNQTNITELVPGDFNGDGMFDFIAIPKGDKPTLHLYNSTSYNSTIKFEESSDWASYTVPDKTERGYLAGDFNGDGISDLLIYKKKGTDYTVLYSQVENGVIKPLNRIENHSIEHKWDEPSVVDFNGDGINDIYNIHAADGNNYGYGTDVLVFGNSENSVINKHFSDVGNFSGSQVAIQVFTGDFNGDAKTDIFVVHPSASRVYYSNGNGLTRVSCNYAPYNPTNLDGFVADINGDGKDDFYVAGTDFNGNLTLKAVINTDCGKKVWNSYDVDFNDIIADNICLGDFKGTGKTSFIAFGTMKNGNNADYKATLLVNSKYEMPLVTGITDGLGCKVSISYVRMRDLIVKNTETLPYPYRNPDNQHTHIVSSLIDGLQQNSYSYANGLLHTIGRGFLGFKKFTQYDSNNNINVTSTYKIDNTLCMLGIDSTETKIKNSVISQTAYTNNVVTLANGTKMFQTSGSATKNYDLNSGQLESTKTEVSTFDQYGNELTKTETTNENDIVVTRNSYLNYSNRYILGLPISITKINSRYGQATTSVVEANTYAENSILPRRKTVTSNDGTSDITDYSYDVCGNVLSERNSYENVVDSVTKTYTYDTDKRLVTKIVENGNYSTTYSYSPNTDDVATETGADGITITYETDAFGRKTRSTTVNGSKSGTLLWANGIDNSPEGAVYAVEKKKTDQPDIIDFYNEYRQKIRSLTTTFGEKTVFTDYEYYTTNGKIRKEYEPYTSGETLRSKFYQYDAIGRLLSTLFPDGTTETHTYENSFDLGNKHIVTDRLGNSTESISNVYNETVSTTDAEGNVVNYSYDSNGNCIEVNGSRTSIDMTYDGFGNLIKLIDTDRGEITYKYNTRKELIEETESGKGTTIYKYDPTGNIVECNSPEGVINYTYHPTIKNRLLKIEKAATKQAWTYAYDSGNHVTREVRVSGNDSMQMRFVYEKDLLKQIIYPNGFSVTNEYNSGILSKVRHTVEADKVYWQLNQTDSKNRPTKYTVGGDKVIRISYDEESGRPLRIDNAGKMVHKYTYDCLGNMLSHSDSINNQSETFTYDNLYRLTGAKIANNPIDAYTYDDAGNILSKTSLGSINYFDNSNQIDYVTANYGTKLKQWPEIEYNSFHKVTRIKNSLSSYAVTYGLDNEKERTTDVFAAINTRKYFGRFYETLSNYSDGELTNSNTCHIFAGNTEICSITNGKYDSDVYKYYDAIGSVVGVYNRSANKLTQYSYDAWGRSRTATNWAAYNKSYPEGNGYTGHEYLSLFELIDMKGRMYDPIVGRFISPDPHVQDPANSQNLNRYAYCLNNPLRYTDPTGEFFIFDDFIWGMIKGICEGSNIIRSGYQQAINSARIWGGLFATGAGRNFWTASMELLSRFTYQSIQTTLGFFTAHAYNTLSYTGTVHVKYGAVVLPAKWMKGSSAMTLSNYIIGNKNTEANANNSTFQHEYGHYLQSMKLGYLYLTNVGIPSLVSAAKGKDHRYKDFEVDASKKGHNFLIKRVPTLNWDYLNNPLTTKKPLTNTPRNNYLSNKSEYETSKEQQDLEGEIYEW